MKRYTRCTCFFLIFFILMLFGFFPGFSHAQENAQTNGNGKTRYVSIDFNDVDISVFIKFISELTEKNFVIDNRVKGKVTIISPSKISVEEAYKVFESVLEVHGFATVQAGEVIKVIPAPDARSKNIETLIRDEGGSPDDRIVTQLIPLRYADADEIKRLFAPLVSKSSVMLSYQPTNMLIITDIYSNILRLMDILKVVDVMGIGQEISVVSLENADAEKMVRLLTTVFQQARGVPGAKKGAAAVLERSRFVADDRTNSVVILASEDETLRIRQLIKKLDISIPKGKERIHVYYLEHATAEELAETLQSLSGKSGSAASKDPGKKTSPIVSDKVQITSDKATNSLIIMAEKEEYMVIENIIKKLDIPRSMVYIESLIMEVNVDKGFSVGTEWVGGGKTGYGSDKDAWIGGGWSGGGDTAYSNLGQIASSAIAGVAALPQGFSMGIIGEQISIGGLTFQNVGAVAQFFKKESGIHILSTPQILTTDNEEAVINVGKNVPYQTKTGTTSSSETYNTYEYRDVGKILKVTPQISKDRLIRLAIELEVTQLDTASDTGGDERPTTFKRTVTTTVIVNDKNTVVLGGLIDDSFSESESRIPCLGDIPGLGWMFKSLSRGREKTNLYIFLTPRVIESQAEAAEIYKMKKEEIDNSDAEDDEQGIKLYQRDRDTPARSITLPDFLE